MCPLCLASIAATVAATTGGGAAATALAVRVKRALTKSTEDPATGETHGNQEPHRQS
jgi:hypothetical protein